MAVSRLAERSSGAAGRPGPPAPAAAPTHLGCRLRGAPNAVFATTRIKALRSRLPAKKGPAARLALMLHCVSVLPAWDPEGRPGTLGRQGARDAHLARTLWSRPAAPLRHELSRPGPRRRPRVWSPALERVYESALSRSNSGHRACVCVCAFVPCCGACAWSEIQRRAAGRPSEIRVTDGTHDRMRARGNSRGADVARM